MRTIAILLDITKNDMVSYYEFTNGVKSDMKTIARKIRDNYKCSYYVSKRVSTYFRG